MPGLRHGELAAPGAQPQWRVGLRCAVSCSVMTVLDSASFRSARLTAATVCGSRSKSSRSASAYPAPPGSLASCLTRTVGACRSLSTTRRTVWVISARCLSSRSGRRPSSRAISPATTSAAMVRRATTVGVMWAARWAAPKAATSSATMLRTWSTSAAIGASADASASDSMSTRRTPSSRCTRGVDVARHGEVEQGQPDGRWTARARWPGDGLRLRAGADRSPSRRRAVQVGGERGRLAVRRVERRPSARRPLTGQTSPSRRYRTRRRRHVSVRRDRGHLDGPGGHARAAGWPGSRRAGRHGPAVRLATTISATPARASVAAASEDIEPAPMTSARLPAAQSATSGAARELLQAEGDQRLPGPVDAGLAVGALADPQGLLEQVVQQPARGVQSPAPSASASLIWPRIWPSPTTIESSPQATEKRWWTARSS